MSVGHADGPGSSIRPKPLPRRRLYGCRTGCAGPASWTVTSETVTLRDGFQVLAPVTVVDDCQGRGLGRRGCAPRTGAPRARAGI
jgi:hypothetical protein